MSLIIPANSAVGGGFEVANSLRFDDGSTDYLSRTPSSAGSQQKFTFSVWVKRCTLGYEYIFSQGYNGNNNNVLVFNDDNSITVWNYQGGFQYLLKTDTDVLFRDVSAWYHFIVAVDTTQATASDRVNMYVNGNLITDFRSGEETYPSLNTNLIINTTNNFKIGTYWDTSIPFDGYMSEVCLIDGQQLDPTSFGEFDENSGIWKPIDVSGLTFGTNGFYLDFQNSGSLGADVSGNGNNFTVNNLTAIDQSTDTPTNNFATLNPLHYNLDNTTENGNLTYNHTNTSGYPYIFSTLGVTKGKWYVECKHISDNSLIGISASDENNSSFLGSTANSYGYYNSTGVYNNGSPISGYGYYGAQSIIGIGLDLDNNKLYFSSDEGTWQNSGDPESGSTGTGAISLASDKTWLIGVGGAGGGQKLEMNFGSPPFAISSGNTDGNGYGNFEYAVPSGYLSLCTKNLSKVLG